MGPIKFRVSPKYFHNEIKWILVVAQIFGLLPVRGVTERSCENLRFLWRSKRLIYAILLIIASSMTSSMVLLRILQRDLRFRSVGAFVFNGNGVIVAIAFLRLARNWPKLIRYWTKLENSLSHYEGDIPQYRKYNAVVGVILSAAIIEHLLAVMSVYTRIKQENDSHWTEIYFHNNFPHIFDYIPFSLPIAIIMVIINVCNVISWNFLDAFLMVISMSLTYRFKQITKRVASAYKQQITSKEFWMKLREDYNKFCVLSRIINDRLSFILMISYCTNMFFIMTQLYWSLIETSTTLESIYFYFSFGLLLSRTIAVTLFAAKINDESRKPIGYLLSLESKAFNAEVERFILQIHVDPVALTGSNFFTITRGLLLSMAGSIVTYELFLIQSHVTFGY